ncbi:MAG TPA: shikimate dehydrogenase [Sphingomicrobium sp.]|nr:shikimate dehydrogenase [Sphingomicrobium sp.]
MTAYAEVIGDPIAQSQSPVIYGFWLKALKIDAAYRRTQVTRADLPDYLAKRRADPDWRGCNVTMPLKLDAVALADDATDRAVAAGAANLLIPRQGKLVAANTDVGGVIAIVEHMRQAGAAMDSVTVLGTGGAARAVLVALRLCKIPTVIIEARDMGEARKLSAEFATDEPQPFDAPIETDGLINATPLGMPGRPDLCCVLDALPRDGWVFDLVTLADTPLIERARARSLRVANGLAMLVEQAAESFPLLFDAKPPRDHDAALFTALGA